jgi:hypothetical protein
MSKLLLLFQAAAIDAHQLEHHKVTRLGNALQAERAHTQHTAVNTAILVRPASNAGVSAAAAAAACQKSV